MKRCIKFLACLFAIVLCVSVFSSCNSSEESGIRYLAVKLTGSDMWSIVDVNSGEIIYKDEFKRPPSRIVNKKFYVQNENELYDYFSVDDVTKPINKESFLSVTCFNNNDIAMAVLKGKGISIIDGNCNVVANLDNSIISASVFSNGYSNICNENNKYGYINEKGEIVIKPSYDYAEGFSQDGYAIVGVKKSVKGDGDDDQYTYTVIDTKEVALFSFSSSEYKPLGAFENGYLTVIANDDEIILLDKSGKKCCSVGSLNWDALFDCYVNNGIIVFCDGDVCGLKDAKGEVVLRAKYDKLLPVAAHNYSYFIACKQEKYGVVDKNDKVIIPFNYSFLSFLNEDVILFSEDKMYSLMNMELKDICQSNFSEFSLISTSDFLIRSNDFNADKEAEKLMSNISSTSFFKTHTGMHLSDFKDQLSMATWADTDTRTVHDYDDSFFYTYSFDKYLSSQTYEYIYGYAIPNDAKYNYNANLVFVKAESSKYEDFQPGSEEALAKAFDSKIPKHGFK